jgi:hypothetical protein
VSFAQRAERLVHCGFRGADQSGKFRLGNDKRIRTTPACPDRSVVEVHEYLSQTASRIPAEVDTALCRHAELGADRLVERATDRVMGFQASVQFRLHDYSREHRIRRPGRS